MAESTAFPPFSPAVTQAAVQAASTAYPADYLIEHMLKLSHYLIDLANHSMLFGPAGSDPYSPSLHTLLLRLLNKQLAPSRLPTGFLTPEHTTAQVRLRSDKEAADRPLADYEDLYYALMSRMQEMYQLLKLRIQSGFNMASHAVCEDGPSLAELHASLAQYWTVFNDAACGRALDNAVREARVQAIREEVVRQVEIDNMTVEDAQEQLEQLYSADVYNGIVGLHFVQDWAPAMVGAYLEHKYRGMLDLEKKDAAARARTQRRLAKMNSVKESLAAAAAAADDKLRVQRHIAQAVKKTASTRRDSRHDNLSPTVLQETTTTTTTTLSQSSHHANLPNLHCSPESHVQLHPGTQHEAHAAALSSPQPDMQRERAYQEHLHTLVEWQMKTQRVSEYSSYLRARASHGAQHVVEGTRRTTESVAASDSADLLAPDVALDLDLHLGEDMEF
ncbi:hypothetical protein ACJQWK_10799 [Exserohilum turcicum]|uniref:Uncharacterized protein n=1 Tax=Exserohilum turcicum (strain 28A) TaxID=671987 RepID=R0JYM3_EXST2|nr:uncharacterized protein SETTUDRAFT_35192 [Exserohilum turcica Et28A]EOA81347.1 hypothetical protein SETTUDRAFT_35192 [Exserohilum turcica Et28A]